MTRDIIDNRIVETVPYDYKKGDIVFVKIVPGWFRIEDIDRDWDKWHLVRVYENDSPVKELRCTENWLGPRLLRKDKKHGRIRS